MITTSIKYINNLSMIFVLVICMSGFGFAQEVADTICNAPDGQVDAGIVFTDSAETTFVKCFDGYVLQPVGADMLYTNTVIYTTDKKPAPITGLTPVGYSSEYGPVYKLRDALLTKTGTDEPVFGTASVDTASSMKQYITWMLVGLLVALGILTVVRRRERD